MNTPWPNAITRIVEQQTEDLQRKRTRLTAERSALDEQIAQIESELNELEIAVKVYRRFSEAHPATVPVQVRPRPGAQAVRDDGGPTANDGSDGSNGALGRLEGVKVADAAEMVLRFLGGSAETGELRDMLVTRGALRPDRNAYSYLLKTLREKPDRFTKVERGTWALQED